MRTLDPRPCLIIALALCALGPPAALAASSAASSASESIGFSIGSVSGSLKQSSASSSRATDVAAGDYEVVEIAAVDDSDADRLRLRLHPRPDRAGAGEVVLELPRLAFEEGRLVPGATVTARARPYGVEFASGATGRAFFLVLEDEWYRELRANALPT